MRPAEGAPGSQAPLGCHLRGPAHGVRGGASAAGGARSAAEGHPVLRMLPPDRARRWREGGAAALAAGLHFAPALTPAAGAAPAARASGPPWAPGPPSARRAPAPAAVPRCDWRAAGPATCCVSEQPGGGGPVCARRSLLVSLALLSFRRQKPS